MKKRSIEKSKEDYLEAVLIIINKDGACRVTDIAHQMGFSKARTSVALKKLEEDGGIIRDDWRIVLTDKGMDIAKAVYERHKFFSNWFKKIGVSDKNAEEDACMIEHILSEETYVRIKEYIKNSSCV